MSPAAGILIASAGIMSLRGALLALTPAAVAVAAILSWRARRSLVARIAALGLLGGVAATLAYDGVRLILLRLDVVSRPFLSIELYGALIAGSDQGYLSRWAGWIFHFWNGASFGVFFALAFPRPTILKGIFWGLFLELAVVLTSPRLLALTIQGELLASSLIGHVAYGVTLASVVGRAPAARWAGLFGR